MGCWQIGSINRSGVTTGVHIEATHCLIVQSVQQAVCGSKGLVVLSHVMTGHATKLPFIRPEPAFLTGVINLLTLQACLPHTRCVRCKSMMCPHGMHADEEPLWLHAPPAVPLWRSWHSAEEAAAESQPQASAPSPLAALMALAVEGPLLPGLQQQVCWLPHSKHMLFSVQLGT